jgi:hypothetical protein
VVNALFYTFSTIAQTLAGAIALLGAFVLFRRQSLNAEIESNASQIAAVLESVLDRDEIRTLSRHGLYRELLEHSAHVTIPTGTYQATRELGRLPVLLDRQDLLVRRFKIAFYLTVGLIMTSVFTLTIAQDLATSASLTGLAFVIGLLWLAGCLVSYVLLMLESLK